jgi:hypothetical protein
MSGDIELEIDIDGAERVPGALKRGLKDGLEDVGEHLQKEGVDKGQDALLSTDRIWRKRVYHGFETDTNQFNRYYRWKGEIHNRAPHAVIVDRGLKPGANPQVQDIIEWVDSKITPNADAQESAEEADVEEWDPQLQELAAEHGAAIVISSFAIKYGLEEDGYPGINFTGTIESYLEQIGKPHAKSKVEKHMNRELRKSGLK